MVGSPPPHGISNRRRGKLYFTNNKASTTVTTRSAKGNRHRLSSRTKFAFQLSDEGDDALMEHNRSLASEHIDSIEEEASAAADRSRRVHARSGGGTAKRSKVYDYKRYLHRLVRKEFPEFTTSARTMECMSNFMSDIFDRIAEEAGLQAHEHGRQTLTEFDIKHATRILMPGGLARHAINLAKHKLVQLQASMEADGRPPSASRNGMHDDEE